MLTRTSIPFVSRHFRKISASPKPNPKKEPFYTFEDLLKLMLLDVKMGKDRADAANQAAEHNYPLRDCECPATHPSQNARFSAGYPSRISAAIVEL